MEEGMIGWFPKDNDSGVGAQFPDGSQKAIALGTEDFLFQKQHVQVRFGFDMGEH
jgi:hypothetical protein